MQCREITGIARTAFGEKSGEYRSFGSTDLNGLSDNDLIRHTSNVLAAANTAAYTAAITAKGYTALMGTTLATAKTDFMALLAAFDLAESNRPIVTLNRLAAANTLYDELMAMSEIAQVYYQNRNERKAEQYAVNSTVGSTVRSGDLSPGEMETREVTGINPDTNVRAKAYGGTIEIWFAQTQDGPPEPDHIVTIPPTEDGGDYLEFPASALGFDRPTGYVHFVLNNVADTEVAYRVKFE